MTAATASFDTSSLDAAGFDLLAKTHWPDLYKYAYRLCGDSHTAEDLVQESLLRAWRSRDSLLQPGAVKGWLKTIVRRENARRFERARPQEVDLPVEEIGAGPKTYDTSTEAFVLRNAIRALPAEYREPLILQVLHGLSQQEIADRLGLTSAGVGTRLFRARQKLRQAMGELG
jgi:RNA polymerase sigma-70 factor (ECF subfamily)